jgi:hypothetical protein
MEKQYKYKVIIPNPDKENETIEKLLQEKVDVLNFLEINSNTFQRICNGTLKCSQKETLRLYGIKIEKLAISKVKKDKNERQKEKSLEFAKTLLSK